MDDHATTADVRAGIQHALAPPAPAPRVARTVATVWDGLPARGHGGTAEIVAYARTLGKPVTVIWREGVTRD